jgi:prepilin-type N-terminal cleavage/methylation domain-containing protein
MTLTHRMSRQDGFTLLEVLAVCAILGILATFVYTVILGQDQSAMDAEAKSNARSMLWKVQSCFTSTGDYTLCDETTEQEPPPGITWGDGPGEVQVVRGPETTRYQVTVSALSRAKSDGKNHVFTIVKEVDGNDERICTSDGSNDAGGCDGGVW